jgi:hypothetical protein
MAALNTHHNGKNDWSFENPEETNTPVDIPATEKRT